MTPYRQLMREMPRPAPERAAASSPPAATSRCSGGTGRPPGAGGGSSSRRSSVAPADPTPQFKAADGRLQTRTIASARITFFRPAAPRSPAAPRDAPGKASGGDAPVGRPALPPAAPAAPPAPAPRPGHSPGVAPSKPQRPHLPLPPLFFFSFRNRLWGRVLMRSPQPVSKAAK